MSTITHSEVINYLRQFGREVSRNAEEMTARAHPMAAHFDADAEKANTEIESVIERLFRREEAQRLEWENSQPQRGMRDREDFHSDI